MDEISAIEKAIRELPEDSRIAFSLYELDGDAAKARLQIYGMFTVSENTVLIFQAKYRNFAPFDFCVDSRVLRLCLCFQQYGSIVRFQLDIAFEVNSR